MSTECTLRRWLLLDGLGATISAVSLGLILPALDNYFGMPRILLIPLALIAAVFALTSIAGALQLLAISPALHLRRIALANLSYCLLTATCLAYYRHTLLAFDYFYFVGEIMLVTFLSLKELQIARKTAIP